MANDTQISISPAEWSAELAFWLGQALATATLQDLQKQIEAGAKAFAIYAGGQMVGAFLLRVDATSKGPQGVIVAAASSVPGVDMTVSVVPVIESLFTGVQSVRFHTAKPAVARKMRGLGYRQEEIICVKDLTA